MKAWNVSLGAEGKERKRAHDMIGSNLTSESVALTFSLESGGEEIRKAPMAYVPDLPAKVVQLLDQNDRWLSHNTHLKLTHLHDFLTCSLGRLTANADTIPPGEIWLKVGGDKGGGSMKVNFQILNVPHPNSPANTCVFLAYEGPDTKTNLHVVLARYKSQIDSLKDLKWR